MHDTSMPLAHRKHQCLPSSGNIKCTTIPVVKQQIHYRPATPVCGLASHPHTHTRCRAELPRSTRSCRGCMWLSMSPMGSMRPPSLHSHVPPTAPLAPIHLPAQILVAINGDKLGIESDSEVPASLQCRGYGTATINQTCNDVAVLHAHCEHGRLVLVNSGCMTSIHPQLH